jgi:hypothetical protein
MIAALNLTVPGVFPGVLRVVRGVLPGVFPGVLRVVRGVTATDFAGVLPGVLPFAGRDAGVIARLLVSSFNGVRGVWAMPPLVSG